MHFHRVILSKIVAYGLLCLACKPGEQLSSSRSTKEDLADNTQKSDENSDTADPLIEEKANFSVPISGTNLVFSVGRDTNIETIDAYIVGQVDKLTASRINEQQFVISDLPLGSQELIITGVSVGVDAAAKDYDRGVRIPIESKDGSSIDLGAVDLPKTGSLNGLFEMEGVAAFSTVSVEITGTKIAATAPRNTGEFVFNRLPAGVHNLSWKQKDNPQLSEAKALVVAATSNKILSRNLTRSQPNSPSNFRIQASGTGFALSWISGGGNPTGYLVYRSNEADKFQPINGKSYAPGLLASGSVVANLALNNVKDNDIMSGSSYFYKVFAYNQNFVYSAPRLGTATGAAPNNVYKKYRIFIDSVANNCQSDGTAQVQALNFYIDNNWQVNDFTSNTNVGKIGPYPVTVSVNNMYNSAYDAFYAFQDDNLAWSSSFHSYAQTSPYNFLSQKNSDGIFFEMDFGSAAVGLEGMEILGGEPPFFPECSPDSYRILATNDSQTWTEIPGSAREENTQSRVRYYFKKASKPLSPSNFTLLGNAGQIQLSWVSAAGNEVGYLLARSRMPQPFVPENGRTYGSGMIEGAYDILLDGQQLQYTDTNFDELSSPYYYTLVSYDSLHQYSPSIIGRATPEKRESYRYYRFVILSILGGGPRMSWMESLKFKLDATWVDQYSFTGMDGMIAGIPVALSESSANGANHAFGLFGNGYWQTAKPSFNDEGMNDSISKSGEYVQFDFGKNPSAITGFRALGNTAIDSNGRYSSSMYYQVPDMVRLERSQDGIKWEIIEGSFSTFSFAQELELVW